MKPKKGFTLIELLVVIGIVAVLSVVVILTLNPSELLKQSRDSTRLSDLSIIKKAITLYLAAVTSPSIHGAVGTCYMSVATTTPPNRCGNLFGVPYSTELATSSQGIKGYGVIDGGWMPVNFSSISSGAPFSNLPIDPINDDTNYYAYAASSTTLIFEINANMESNKYKNGGAKDVESTDGGDNANWFEAGTAPGLAL